VWKSLLPLFQLNFQALFILGYVSYALLKLGSHHPSASHRVQSKDDPGKKAMLGWVWYFTAVIPATWEVEVRRIQVQGQFRQKN
jgi:hypothetical protein